MKMRHLQMDKKDTYKISSACLNFALVVVVVLLMVEVAVELLSGKIYLSALAIYASWVGVALIARIVLRRVEQGLRIGTYHYLAICSYAVLCMFLWFTFPVNVILSAFSIVVGVLSYRKKAGLE